MDLVITVRLYNYVILFINGRSSSDPYAGNEVVQEAVRASPDPFRTFPGASGEVGDPLRSTSPPPWFIAEPHTPRVKQDFLVSLLALFDGYFNATFVHIIKYSNNLIFTCMLVHVHPNIQH